MVMFYEYFATTSKLQEARVPLQLWVTEQASGLLVEEGQFDGGLFLFSSFTNIFFYYYKLAWHVFYAC